MMPEFPDHKFYNYNKRRYNTIYPVKTELLDEKDPIQKKHKDKLIVGVTGGSVAFFLSMKGRDALVKELQKHSKFAKKKIEIVRIALGGFKQPQQLMTLNYLLSIGSEFDIVINIDGFNEAALPLSDNVPRNIFPFYPRNWFEQIGYKSDIKFFSLML